MTISNDAIKAINAQTALITKAKYALTQYLEGPPRGISQSACINALLVLFDGPEQRETDALARAALEADAPTLAEVEGLLRMVESKNV